MTLNRSTITSQPVQRLTLYLSDQDRFGNPIRDIQRWADEAIIILCTLAGGATRMPVAEGAWFIEETGQMIRENVHMIFANIDPERFHNQRSVVIDFMERFGQATGQETVVAEYDGQMHFMKIEQADLARIA